VVHRVSIVKSRDHALGVREALDAVKPDVTALSLDVKKLLIKPNFVSTEVPLSATPVEAVIGTLDFFLNDCDHDFSEVIVAESPADRPFQYGVRNFGYDEIKKRYPRVELVDLDSFEEKEITLDDLKGEKVEIPVAAPVIDPAFLKVSPTRPKTHDTVVVTLSVKNLVMGAIKRGYKWRMHRGYLAINFNIAKVMDWIRPAVGIIDGVEGMEGNGPVGGKRKPWGAVFASASPPALDWVVTRAMGFSPESVGYLYFMRCLGMIDENDIQVIGEPLSEITTRFLPHESYAEQLSWKEELKRLSLPPCSEGADSADQGRDLLELAKRGKGLHGLR